MERIRAAVNLFVLPDQLIERFEARACLNFDVSDNVSCVRPAFL